MIRAAQVQLIDQNGENHGVVPTRQALEMALDAGMDLMEINPNGDVPICKIMDFGKWKYEEKKKKNETKKKTKIVETKELKFRPNIEIHDYNTKMKQAKKFIDGGDKVKISLKFRGREIAHQEYAKNLFDRIIEEMGETVILDVRPKFEGKQMMMIMAPAIAS